MDKNLNKAPTAILILPKSKGSDDANIYNKVTEDPSHKHSHIKAQQSTKNL